MKRAVSFMAIFILTFSIGIALGWNHYSPEPTFAERSNLPDSDYAQSKTEVNGLKGFDENPQQTTRVSISQHEAYNDVLSFLRGLVKHKAKTKKNTFHIAPVESSGFNEYTQAYWIEDKSIVFIPLSTLAVSADEMEDYVADEIYEKYRRDLRTDVVPTDAEVVSRYFISKAEADQIITDCLQSGEKVVINKKRK